MYNKSAKTLQRKVTLYDKFIIQQKYQDEVFSKYSNESVQDFRFALSERIRQEIFFATFVKKSESIIKSTVLMRVLKYLIQQKVYHL